MVTIPELLTLSQSLEKEFDPVPPQIMSWNGQVQFLSSETYILKNPITNTSGPCSIYTQGSIVRKILLENSKKTSKIPICRIDAMMAELNWVNKSDLEEIEDRNILQAIQSYDAYMESIRAKYWIESQKIFDQLGV